MLILDYVNIDLLVLKYAIGRKIARDYGTYHKNSGIEYSFVMFIEGINFLRSCSTSTKLRK